jgi:diguanylate cyclase (GGDEF)-like protein
VELVGSGGATTALRGRAGPSLWAKLPTGGTLPEEVWRRRHRGILLLLWLHVPAIFFFALAMGMPLIHCLEEAGGIAIFAIGAEYFRGQRTVTMVLTAMGLLTASAALVHLSNGVIEMHFHYFVMVGVITLYQDWKPFLVAIGYVVLQHGVMGALWPESVYNHPAAVASPWKWASIHGGFILGMSAAGIVTWRLNEGLLGGLSERQQRLTEAQEQARLGSWERDLRTGEVLWSDQHFELLEIPPDVVDARERFLAMIDAEDRAQFEAAVARAMEGVPFALDVRVSLPSGARRWLHTRGEAVEWDAGRPALLAGTTQDVTERHQSEDSLKETLSLLNATLDSTADGILVVDGDGRIRSSNHQFAEMWRIPRAVLDAGDDEGAMAVVLDQLVDPDGFVAKVRELYAQPDAESYDVLEFRDGRVFDRYSKPQRVAGMPVGRVWSFRDVTDRKRLEAELAHQAFHDSLTQLANQMLFRDRVSHALSRASRRGQGLLAVMFVDLDNFKRVNDSMGHPAGDALLVAVAERLRECLRTSDTAARLGGDEFAVLLEEATSETDANQVATRVLESLRQPYEVAGKEVVITASIGLAFNTGGAESTDVLLRNADLAMYRAKGLGRNRHELFEPGMHSAVVERLDLEADLRRAIERREFVLQYQPIIDLQDGALAGVEALVRWNHPTRGMLAPLTFIGVAEETGLINDIGLQVLEAALPQAQRWRAHAGHEGLLLSVNVSPGQLADGRLQTWLHDVMKSTGTDPATTILEITESVTVRREAAHQLEALKGLGVCLAIDDFGTGYSSLSYLQRLPIDVLKIDRSFVSGPGHDNATLPRAIVELSHALRLRTIAEGVETAEQGRRLRAWGCDLAQGFHYHRPLDPDAVTALLARG